MGWALAAEAKRQGARVTVVTGPVNLEPLRGVETVRVTTALDMHRETLRRSQAADLVIAAAAVSDWRFVKPARHKIKRKPGAVTLKLVPNPDIIKDAARRRRPGQVFVGFALETRDIVASGRRKLNAKRLDLIVANSAATLGAAGSVFHLVSKDSVSIVRGSKAVAAKAILRSAHERRTA